jgi:F-type H+-transporting ATPase subunit delta
MAMSELAVAKRYAKALFEVALEQNRFAQVEKELQVVVATFRETPALMSWLHHPTTDAARKKELFSSIFKGVSSLTRNTLFLLVDRDRVGLMEALAEEFQHLSLAAKGLVEAVVTTAFPLTDKGKQQLAARFQPIVGKRLQLKEVVNADILGGVIVQVGDRLYDGSLKTKLIRFQEHLKGTEVG